MLLIEYVGRICLRSLTDGHLGRHLEYFKTLNDARVASVGFIKYNASTTRINKEKNFKIKFQVILVFYRTIMIEHVSTQLTVFHCLCPLPASRKGLRLPLRSALFGEGGRDWRPWRWNLSRCCCVHSNIINMSFLYIVLLFYNPFSAETNMTYQPFFAYQFT